MKYSNTITKEISSQVNKTRYVIPKFYTQWNKLSDSIVHSLFLLSPYVTKEFLSSVDRNTYNSSLLISLWAIKDAPIYCITKNLTDALIQTDLEGVEKILADLPIAIPTFLVLFPDKALLTPDGDAIEYMVVHAAEKNNPQNSGGSSRRYPDISITPLFCEELSIHLAFVDNAKPANCWKASVSLENDGTISFETGGDVGSGNMNMSKADEQFIEVMRSLSLQILFLLAYQPEIFTNIEEQETRTSIGRGFGKPSPLERAATRYPRWLGKDKVEDDREDLKRQKSGSGSHNSPVGHWRKGHWRRTATGKGRLDRKYNWIKPVRINGFDD
jgi:hypothetical protein